MADSAIPATTPSAAPSAAPAAAPTATPASDAGATFDFAAEVDALPAAPGDEPATDIADEPILDDSPIEDEPAAEAAPEAAEETTPEGTPEPVAEEELPDGVRKQIRRDGVPQYVMPEKTFRDFQAAAKQIGQYETAFGEPLTEGSLAKAVQAHNYVRDFELDLVSASPQDQRDLAEHFINFARSKQQAGEIDSNYNPIANFVAHLAAVDPGVDHAIRNWLEPEILLANMAAAWADPKIDDNLRRSLQHLANYNFGDYNVERLLRKAPAPREQPNARPAATPQQMLKQGEAQRAEAFSNWRTKANGAVADVIGDQIKSLIEPADKDGKPIDTYKNFPEQKKNLIGRLQREAVDALKRDSNFQGEITRMQREARETRSEQRRTALLDALQSKYRVRIARELNPNHNPVIKAVLGEAARFVQSQANGRGERRLSAQTQKQPGSGTGGPVPRKILPNAANVPAGRSTVEAWIDEVEATFR